MTTTEPVITVTEEARQRILEIRSREDDAADLALSLRIGGRRGPAYGYELDFVRMADIDDSATLARYGDLPVAIPAASVEGLRGATVHFDGRGLSIENPNRPPPEPWWPGDEAPMEQRVAAVLEHEINPAIAGHGGWVELIAVEDGDVHLSLGGGCHGCALAQVTLRQSIEVGLRSWVPEIRAVVDVTDHASGDDPYY
jgi:Fe/S biogenesis protein NfuA